MNEQGAFVAALLDSSRRAFAAGAVLHLQEQEPEVFAAAEVRFDELVDDAQLRLQHLAEALACGRVEIFALDVAWLAATHAARALPLALLQASLRALKAELQENLPADAAARCRPYLDAGLQAAAALPQAPASLLAQEEPLVDVARRFVLAVLEGDRASAEAVVVTALDAGASVAELHEHVIAKAQLEIGRMWQAGEVHVASEHFGSRIVEDVLAQLRARMRKQAATGRTVLVTSVSGNLHDIGPRIVADHFEMNGWRSIFLGANMPVGDLVQAVADFEPDLVALSAGLGVNVRAVADAVAALHAARPELPVLVGGRPFALVDGLWKDVGADGCAVDGATAVRRALELVGPA